MAATSSAATGRNTSISSPAGASAISAGITAKSGKPSAVSAVRIMSIRASAIGGEELAELLVSVVPVRNARCFRATGGSEAVELGLQAAMLHTGRQGFLSVEGSYHGNTLGTLSIGASENRKSLKNLLPHCRKIEQPLDRKAASKVEAMLRKRDVAAFVIEPISINQGVVIPDGEFIRRVRAACARTGTLFIADEVACGFGRTGRLFASSISC